MMWFSVHRWQVRCNATGTVGVVLLRVGNSQWKNWDREASVEGVAAGSLSACQMGPVGHWMKWKKCTLNERHHVTDARFFHDAINNSRETQKPQLCCSFLWSPLSEVMLPPS